MPEDKKPFMVLEAVKELAQLRADIVTGGLLKVITEGAVQKTPEWKAFCEVVDKQAEFITALNTAEAAFKAGCEDIFIETDEKKFPGGQIKMRSTIEYDGSEAVIWAIKHGHNELLSLVKGKFKKMCSGINPLLEGKAFVKKEKVGKMYIDSDLSQYLEDGKG